MSRPPEPLPSDSYSYDVFISYSTQDHDWVRGELLRRLEDAGLKCCIDYRDFRLGAPAIKELERAATNSRKTLMVITPHYLQSKWTEFERYLLQTPDPLNKELRLIPLLKEPCELPLSIGYLTYLNFAAADDLIFVWTQLFTALGKPPEAAPPQETAPSQWLLAHPYGMPPHFTGRMAERQMLSHWLNQDSQHPLLVLRALGGFGKSALTWHWLLHDVQPRQWQRVVWWSFYEEQADFNNFLRVTLTYLSGYEPGDTPPRQQLEQLLMLLHQVPVLLVMDGFERELRAYSTMGAAYQGDEIPPTPLQKGGTENISFPLLNGGQRGDRDCINPYAETFLRSLSSLPHLRSKVLMTTRLRPRPVEVTGGTLLQGCHEAELTQMQPDDAVAFFRSQGIRGNRTEIEHACAAYGYHPLSLRLLSGLVVNDFRNSGDIKVAQRLDITGDLVQRQHHVLEQSYQSLTDAQPHCLFPQPGGLWRVGGD